VRTATDAAARAVMVRMRWRDMECSWMLFRVLLRLLRRASAKCPR
jgi:hypothetical protein